MIALGCFRLCSQGLVHMQKLEHSNSEPQKNSSDYFVCYNFALTALCEFPWGCVGVTKATDDVLPTRGGQHFTSW